MKSVSFIKPLIWIGTSLRDLKDFPEELRKPFGFALDQAQRGGKHPNAKPLKGFKGAGVLEVVENYDGDTFRAVYTVKYSSVVYVLHAFQKKSKHGISTSKQDIDLVSRRLRVADEDFLRRNIYEK